MVYYGKNENVKPKILYNVFRYYQFQKGYGLHGFANAMTVSKVNILCEIICCFSHIT